MVNNNAVVPYVLAMIVCDEAWRDPSTGKLTLLGIFSVVSGELFPLQRPQIVIYFALTDGRGRFPLSVRFVSVGEQDELIAEVMTVVHFEDARAVHEGETRFVGTEFAGPGEYRFQLLLGDQLLLERRIQVMHTGQ